MQKTHSLLEREVVFLAGEKVMYSEMKIRPGFFEEMMGESCVNKMVLLLYFDLFWWMSVMVRVVRRGVEAKDLSSVEMLVCCESSSSHDSPLE